MMKEGRGKKVETTRGSKKSKKKEKEMPLSLDEFTKRMCTNLVFLGMINFVIVR